MNWKFVFSKFFLTISQKQNLNLICAIIVNIKWEQKMGKWVNFYVLISIVDSFSEKIS